MRRQLLSIIFLGLSLTPFVISEYCLVEKLNNDMKNLLKDQGDPAQSLQKLQMMLGQYNGKLTSTIGALKSDDVKAGEKSLEEVKSSLGMVTDFVQTDPTINSIPGFKELSGQLMKLAQITNMLTLDKLGDQLKNVFGILGMVTNKLKDSAGGAGAAAASSGLPIPG